MDIYEFICKNDVDFAAHLVKQADLKEAEKALKVKFGPQMTEYLTEYGYLGYESIEFYGMNSRQGMLSDMIQQTQYLHQYFAATAGYIAFENDGEGDYVLIDSADQVYRYCSEENTLTACDERLFDYILRRFEEEQELLA